MHVAGPGAGIVKAGAMCENLCVMVFETHVPCEQFLRFHRLLASRVALLRFQFLVIGVLSDCGHTRHVRSPRHAEV